RLLVAFPAGAIGTALWFEPSASPVDLEVRGAINPVERPNGMRGISVVVRADARELRAHDVRLEGLWTLRGSPSNGTSNTTPEVDSGPPVTFHRTTPDGRHHIVLVLEPLLGTTITQAPDALIFASKPPGAPLEMRMTALTDE